MTTLGLCRVRPGQGVLELVNCSGPPGYPLGIRPCPEHGMLGFGFRSACRGIVEGYAPYGRGVAPRTRGRGKFASCQMGF